MPKIYFNKIKFLFLISACLWITLGLYNSNKTTTYINIRNTKDIDINQGITEQNSSNVIKIFSSGQSKEMKEKVKNERSKQENSDIETNIIRKEIVNEHSTNKDLSQQETNIVDTKTIMEKFMQQNLRDNQASVKDQNVKNVDEYSSIKRVVDAPIKVEEVDEKSLVIGKKTTQNSDDNLDLHVEKHKEHTAKRSGKPTSDNHIHVQVNKPDSEVKTNANPVLTSTSAESHPVDSTKKSFDINVDHSGSQLVKISTTDAKRVKTQQTQPSHTYNVNPYTHKLSKEEIDKQLQRIKKARFSIFLRKERNAELQKFIEHNFDASSGPDTGIHLVDKYFEPRKTRVNSHDYRFIYNGHRICNGAKPPWLIVMVLSSASHVRQRAVIRKTWGRVAQGIVWPGTRKSFDSVKIMFIFGRTGNKEDEKTLIEEKNEYGDIVQADFVDSYNNLTRKVMMGIKWTTKFCPGVRYLMKVDDDTFVHIPNAAKVLKRTRVSETGSIFGNLVKGIVLREGKWGISREVYPFDNYPEYVSGQTYAISGNILGKLFYIAEYLPFIFIEDAFITGIARTVIGANISPVIGFPRVFMPTARPCSFHNNVRVAATNIEPSLMREIWNSLSNSSIEDCYGCISEHC